MPWNEKSVLDERTSFIVDWQRGEASVAELCRRYGVSETTGHETLSRFQAAGWDGLKARSRAPHRHPNAVPEGLATAVLALRGRHPSWGPKKLRAWLAAKHPDWWCAGSCAAGPRRRPGR
jgi:putative transposase